MSLVCDLSGPMHTGSVRFDKSGVGGWEVNSSQQYSAAELEQMMKLQDVLLQAMAFRRTSRTDLNWVFTVQTEPGFPLCHRHGCDETPYPRTSKPPSASRRGSSGSIN